MASWFSGRDFLPAGLTADQVELDGNTIRIHARSSEAAAGCPRCGSISDHVHSRYRRRPADVPAHGRAVEIVLQVRRFRCRAPGCPARIFAERFPPGVIRPHMRRGSSPGPSINVANSTGSSGAGKTSRPFRASVRNDDTWFAGKPCRRATSFTVAPGSSVSATTRAFTSSGHFRFRRPRPPTGRTSNAVSMEKLPPDHHEHPMRRSAQSLEGAVQSPLTYLWQSLVIFYAGIEGDKACRHHIWSARFS
ncbi:zinc-finger of transposase IS204/IS1001/IS1096/IS1165 [Paracoccus aminovorans]|uniref:Zinc-finger of transposase IS204/IS1001/IS1096/IS1165 n=1 Tax=Paracoccus aminovorans TaxID=34004 RepID=A0A1I2Y575_9RHOB|nr:ISL3 family transposase [Paracoccus aminovorans]SFH20884.1 zinc-finger of transposase IS204/IS1001/IS1096/IS1165 [Paracoccus aminovorans]